MGMYDYIRCECDLPNGRQDWEYQTKDTPLQRLDTYTISEDGRLLDPDGVDTKWHGDINFYLSNWAGYRPIAGHKKYRTAMMTTNDDPYEEYDFTARFTNGVLQEISGGRCELEPHIKHITRGEWLGMEKHDG